MNVICLNFAQGRVNSVLMMCSNSMEKLVAPGRYSIPPILRITLISNNFRRTAIKENVEHIPTNVNYYGAIAETIPMMSVTIKILKARGMVIVDSIDSTQTILNATIRKTQKSYQDFLIIFSGMYNAVCCIVSIKTRNWNSAWRVSAPCLIHLLTRLEQLYRVGRRWWIWGLTKLIPD